jgi:diguanylate cyclase (GGDEF)-like protein/PAS domain S-box-containing protein
MLRCLVASGTESTPGARAQEAARLISLFLGDLCVVAMASEDRRVFGPFAVQSRNEAMTAMMRSAIDGADHQRAAWPLAGRALISGERVVIDRIRPGELLGIVNPAMEGYLDHYGLSAMAFLPMRGEHGSIGVVGMGRGPGRPAYTPVELDAAQRIADAVAADVHGETGSLLPLLLIDGATGSSSQAERRFATLVERLPAIVYEAKPGAEGMWLYVSGFVETLLGYTPGEWQADPTLWVRSLHEDDREAVLAAEDRLTAGERIAIEYRMHARDGSIVWVRDESARVLDEEGRVLVEGILTDITERKASEDRLQHLADHDALTDLLNGRRFVEELELELAATRRGMRSSAAIVIDVDGLKFVNDSLGHQAGDELIRTVARTLEGRLRASDAIARLGGDEFGCLLRGASTAEADAVAAELIGTLRELEFVAAGKTMKITASAGIASLDDEAATADSVLAAADMAMYEAKNAGRDRVVRFTESLRAELERGRSWVVRLRDALEHDRFELYAQPVISLRTREVELHELLLRLRDEDGELHGPEAFMPVAERFDLTQAIDHWVLRRALALQRDPAGAGLCLAVNLSARSIGPEVAALLERELAAGGLDPSLLIVEIKETAAIADIHQARMFAEALARLGFRVALDDFGAGLGAFSSLRALPIDYLKIDGQFVGGLARSPVDREIVKAIVSLARAAGRRTVAEFVPDQETLELLAELGVDLAQGFHVGRPRPLKEH